MANFTAQFTSQLPPDDEVHDGWTVLARAVRGKLAGDPTRHPLALLEEADFEKMAEIRDRIGAIVEDPATAERLKPWYSLYCKRPCFSDHYLQAFNRPNVTLVETGRVGVERITPTGAAVDGEEHPLDCLIFATGFDTASSYAQRSGGMRIRGVEGLSLGRKWAQGLSTLHGMHTRGFPNCFVISQAQAGMSPNFPHMLSEQTLHLAHIVERCLKLGVRTVEPTAEAEAGWVDAIVKGGDARRRFIEACTPGYYNNEGRMSDAAARSGVFGEGPVAFVELLRGWREQGDFAGMELDGAHARGLQEQTA